MRTSCIVKLSKLQISKLNTLVQKETSGDVEGNHLLWTVIYKISVKSFNFLIILLIFSYS
jgi:hypothetical protein